MHQQTLQHGFTTARHLWLCSILALGLLLGTQAVVAKECHRETPLPADVRLTAPGPEVPEALARFAGAWPGRPRTNWMSLFPMASTPYREGETFAFSPHDRFVDEVYRRVSGNPEGY